MNISTFLSICLQSLSYQHWWSDHSIIEQWSKTFRSLPLLSSNINSLSHVLWIWSQGFNEDRKDKVWNILNDIVHLIRFKTTNTRSYICALNRIIAPNANINCWPVLYSPLFVKGKHWIDQYVIVWSGIPFFLSSWLQLNSHPHRTHKIVTSFFFYTHILFYMFVVPVYNIDVKSSVRLSFRIGTVLTVQHKHSHIYICLYLLSPFLLLCVKRRKKHQLKWWIDVYKSALSPLVMVISMIQSWTTTTIGTKTVSV